MIWFQTGVNRSAFVKSKDMAITPVTKRVLVLARDIDHAKERARESYPEYAQYPIVEVSKVGGNKTVNQLIFQGKSEKYGRTYQTPDSKIDRRFKKNR